ncbi:hypothetical protein LCGC14_2835140 [marine sediment metagenome]|uniref:Uncharacterized protein n=1 Tax=marine sediment metagenome TaxID=412755 RepID=A0A0F8YCT4_9ZZZZ
MGIDWKEWTKNLITVVIIIAIFVGLYLWGHSSAVNDCQQLEEITGHSTEYIDAQCWIELCPGINVAELDLHYYLDICD